MFSNIFHEREYISITSLDDILLGKGEWKPAFSSLLYRL